MRLFNIIIIFVLGLSLGSFLNCVIWRLRVKKSIWDWHSICPWCQHHLEAKDLFPVLSFIWLKGRCRYCFKNISWQYPLVELVTALSFLIFYFYLGLSWQLVANLIFILFLEIIFVYDLKHYLILDVVTLPAMAVVLVANILLGCDLLNLLLAGVIGGGFFLLQFLISRGKWIGGGDIRLGFLMGIILGYPLILVALILAYFSGSLIGVALILLKRKKWHSAVPFGVFLSLATVVTLLWGQKILEWYLTRLWF
jgi:prepilin signal peptidase PulO-like enzyme (type II secretory pathway)